MGAMREDAPGSVERMSAAGRAWRAVGVALAWVVIGAVMSSCAVACDMSLNFLDWRGRWDREATVACVVYAAALAASGWLHRVTHGPVAGGAAALVTIGLAGLGLFHLP